MKNLANKITVGRIAAVPLFLVLAYTGHIYPALGIFILASVSDLVDGYIARRYNQITTFGKFMDPLADKILLISAMCYFIDAGVIPGWAVAIIIFREFAVSGLRLLASDKNIVLAAAWSGKVKTTCTMVGLCLLFLFPGVLWLKAIVIAAILLSTIYSGTEYFIKNIGVFYD